MAGLLTTYSGELAWNVSSEDFYDFRDRVEAFESLAVIRSGASGIIVTGGEEPERVPLSMVSVNLFPTAGRVISLILRRGSDLVWSGCCGGFW
jgi:hypothetical protein